MKANDTKSTRVEPSSTIARPSSSASRVFPTPPGPVSVMSRAAGSLSQRRLQSSRALLREARSLAERFELRVE
jgi:hypothetical protein